MASDRKDANLGLLVPVSLELPQLGGRLEGEREDHPNIFRIHESYSHVICGLDGIVQNILAPLTPCWMFCNRRTHQRLHLPSFPKSLTTGLLLSQTEGHFLNRKQDLGVGFQLQGPGFHAQHKARKT